MLCNRWYIGVQALDYHKPVARPDGASGHQPSAQDEEESMVLKGLAVAGAIAAVTVAIFVALAIRPAPAGGTLTAAPAGNVVTLPNGMAVPLLQPNSAPGLLDTAPGALLVGSGEGVAFSAAKADSRAANSAIDAATAVDMGCGGK
jgi:hypothetical protein